MALISDEQANVGISRASRVETMNCQSRVRRSVGWMRVLGGRPLRNALPFWHHLLDGPFLAGMCFILKAAQRKTPTPTQHLDLHEPPNVCGLAARVIFRHARIARAKRVGYTRLLGGMYAPQFHTPAREGPIRSTRYAPHPRLKVVDGADDE